MRPTFDYKSLSESQNFLAENFDRSSKTLPISQYFLSLNFFAPQQIVFFISLIKNISMYNNEDLKLQILKVKDANLDIS